MSTAVIRGEGGFGGQPGQRPVAPEIPEREPDSRIALPTREDQALIYRLSGDRNPLHSDPWFARESRRLPQADPARAVHVRVRRSRAGRRARRRRRDEGHRDRRRDSRRRCFPGETLTTSIWRAESGRAVFRTEAAGTDGSNARVVLDDGVVEYTD